MPIRKKFTLFSIGVLFWFILMFAISIAANIDINNKIDEYKQTISNTISLSDESAGKAVELYVAASKKIKETTNFIFYTYVIVLLISISLLIIFTISITKSIAESVKSIIAQIRSLGEGEVDLTRKIEIRSKDKIGVLSDDFNTLMEKICDMPNFKKVIEEDDTLEDIYSRLGRAFSDQFGLDEFIIYEVSGSQKEMKPVYPVMLNYSGIFCDEGILSNCDLCKVKKKGHTVSSIIYPDICRQFNAGHEKTHVCIPMIVGGKVGGVAQFVFDKKYAGADRKDKRIFKAEQYIEESLSVIEAKRLMNKLRESSLKDSLTEPYNRRFLQEYMETLVAGVLKRKKNIGLIMYGLDFFKQVNDSYGHNVGDSVLKETANVIKRCA